MKFNALTAVELFLCTKLLDMIQESEIWKPVPEYEGIYEVSSYGRVKSLSNNRTKREKILKQHEKKSATRIYYRVKLGGRKFGVHQLVAMAFLGHVIMGHVINGQSIVVDHINNIPTDNRLCNLQLLTHRENIIKDRPNRGSSKYTGVYFRAERRKWIAILTINNKRKWIGSFNDELSAHEALIKQKKLPLSSLL